MYVPGGDQSQRVGDPTSSVLVHRILPFGLIQVASVGQLQFNFGTTLPPRSLMPLSICSVSPGKLGICTPQSRQSKRAFLIGNRGIRLSQKAQLALGMVQAHRAGLHRLTQRSSKTCSCIQAWLIDTTMVNSSHQRCFFLWVNKVDLVVTPRLVIFGISVVTVSRPLWELQRRTLCKAKVRTRESRGLCDCPRLAVNAFPAAVGK